MKLHRLHMLLPLLAVGLAHAAISLSGVEIYSKSSVRYGRWEIRMKAAATPGSVSSFFTYYPDSYKGLPTPWREIDIEVLGNKPTGFQSNIITGDAGSKTVSEKYHASTADLSQDFHTYVLDWTPDSVVWRLDGKMLRKTMNQQTADLQDSLETFRMNVWGSNSPGWVGALDTAKLPILQVVNWMAYSAYTPGAGPNGSNFTQSWVDDFTTLNKTRWAFGNWTFDGNYATFTLANAKTINGYLVMMLSTAAQEGEFPATIPSDPLGSTRPTDPTAISSHATPVATLQAHALGQGRLGLTVPTGGAVVCDSQGRVLARAPQVGETTLSGFAHGIVYVHAGAETRAVLID